MLNQAEINKAKDILKGLKGNITLLLLKNDEDDFFTELSRCAHQIASTSDFITPGGPLAANGRMPSAINVASSSRQNIYYAALPEGAELSPFLKTAVRMGNGTSSLKRDTVQRLEALDQDVMIEVLIAGSCPICPKVVELVNQFAVCSPRVTAWVIDANHFPYVKEKYHAVSAPTTVINNRAQIAGAMSEEELLDWINKALSKEDLPDILASLLMTGNSQRAMEIITEEDRTELLVDLLGRNEFTVRLGAMVLIESLQQDAPEKAALLVPGLIRLLDSDMINLRGDAAFMLGRSGDKRAVEPLRRLLSAQNQDLVEVTREALESLRAPVPV